MRRTAIRCCAYALAATLRFFEFVHCGSQWQRLLSDARALDCDRAYFLETLSGQDGGCAQYGARMGGKRRIRVAVPVLRAAWRRSGVRCSARMGERTAPDKELLR
jgi:hypothetical protein